VLKCDSEYEHRFAQEASRRYNDIISGGRPAEYYRAIEAELEQVLVKVRQLGEQSASTYNSDSEKVIGNASSAAARLRRIHERSDQSSNESPSVSTSNSDLIHLEAEGFPALSLSTPTRSEALSQSYAGVVKKSILVQPLMSAFGSEIALQDPSDQDDDESWCVVDRTGRSTRPRPAKSSVPLISTRKHDPATLEKHPNARHARKTIPQAWVQMNKDSQTAQSTSDEAPAAPRRDTHSKPLQRSAHVKGRPPRGQSEVPSLKSSPSKCTLSKVTASKTPGYASPTKASSHRISGGTGSTRSPSPCKSKSARTGTITSKASLPSLQPQGSRLVATPVVGTLHRQSLSVHGRRPTTPVSFGFDGACDDIAADQEFGRESARQWIKSQEADKDSRQSKRAKLDLKITIPDHRTNLSARPISPSRIPIAVAGDSGLVERKSTPALVPIEVGLGISKLIDRASILDPIRRRLSGASSRSRSDSDVSTNGLPREASNTKQSKEKSLGQNGALDELADADADADVTITDATASAKEQLTHADRHTSSTELSQVASSQLLDTIKQSAHRHAIQQGCDSKDTKPLVALSSKEAAKQAKHTNHNVCSSPEKDPAVVECGPMKAQTSLKSGPGGSSLRATATSFTPSPISDVFPTRAQPDCGPATNFLAGSALFPGHVPLIAPTILPTFSHMLPTAPTNRIPQQALLQHPSAVDGAPAWIPREGFFNLPPESRTMTSSLRRGSSAGSSAMLSSASFSNVNSTLYSPTHAPDLCIEQANKPYWNWMNPGQGESGVSVRFGRAAPFPLMNDSQRKGWDIGSGARGYSYGWRGGDGLEISFKGDGPIAERNPNAPFKFNEYEHERGIDNRNQGMPNTGVREWATNEGYPSVPCGNFDIVEATEHLPYRADYPDAWCHGCFPGHL
jgi:hypothetical protein